MARSADPFFRLDAIAVSGCVASDELSVAVLRAAVASNFASSALLGESSSFKPETLTLSLPPGGKARSRPGLDPGFRFMTSTNR